MTTRQLSFAISLCRSGKAKLGTNDGLLTDCQGPKNGPEPCQAPAHSCQVAYPPPGLGASDRDEGSREARERQRVREARERNRPAPHRLGPVGVRTGCLRLELRVRRHGPRIQRWDGQLTVLGGKA